MIRKKFNNKKNLLLVNYTGTIELEDILKNEISILTDTSLPRDLIILEDARGANYKVTPADNTIIKNEVCKYVGNFNTILSAFLQDQPYETAINIDYELQLNFPNYKFKVFTNEEYALQWLSLPFHLVY